MLRVTVELLPNGSAEGLRVLAFGEITATGGAALPIIGSRLKRLPARHETGDMREYPCWSASIWDLVARSNVPRCRAARNCLRDRPFQMCRSSGPVRPVFLCPPAGDPGAGTHVLRRQHPVLHGAGNLRGSLSDGTAPMRGTGWIS